MGRKAKYNDTEKAKTGPGRKARKQGDPVLPRHLFGELFCLFFFYDSWVM